MPPKRRKVAAKAREDRRRERRAAAEPQNEAEREHEESSEADGREDGSQEEETDRVDAEIDALRVKYGIFDDGRSWRAPVRAVETEKVRERHAAAISSLEEATAALGRALDSSLEAAPEEDMLFEARCFAHRLHKRAKVRARDSPAVPARSYFDLMSK